jgi:transketolase
VIGFGAPNKQGTASTHGNTQGKDDITAARAPLGWAHQPFEIPADIRAAWDARVRGRRLASEWQQKFDRYAQAHPELAAEFLRRTEGRVPDAWTGAADELISKVAAEAKTLATRKASEVALNGIAPLLPELMGGSADLTGSNNTFHAGSRAITRASARGNYINYGVREFGMGAIMNGLALHGGFIPYGGTFLVFSDYSRNSLRMAALMRLQVIHVLTHDSIGLGEDGPTHQPVEHLASLRAMPNMSVWRPSDGVETLVAWRAAVENRSGPSCLILSRQNLPHLARTGDQIESIARGGYILKSGPVEPELILIATGSELALAMAAAVKLEDQGRSVRVVSMPCVERFETQAESYRRHVLPDSVPRLVIEAGVPDCWWRYAGPKGDVIGMTSFGRSAPGTDLFEYFGFSQDAVVEAATRILHAAT